MDEWLDAHRRADAASLAELYDPGARHSTAADYHGREAISDMFEQSLAVSGHFRAYNRDCVAQGGYAWETGIAVQRVAVPEERPFDLVGRYMMLLARQPDGSWLIRHLVGAPVRQEPVHNDG